MTFSIFESVESVVLINQISHQRCEGIECLNILVSSKKYYVVFPKSIRI
ncbi:hypothetical protein NARC_60183 [Candidatus Nitrosocosmicus arcticus]|uniref:Uncharacterized protein n=1 Tax=Candidatus Nitrosocosmicus arcticus TaxID=2035267 RepID=A0A557SW15_9ARCH|nr:hypothetical protein NARC_60183 [Candidatus Nitrosocosmicus arcticus]